MAAMTVTQARAAIHELLERVSLGEEVTITRHGQPVAVVVRPDVLRSRRADEALASAAALGEALASARRAPFPPRARLSSDRAEELIAAVRDGRERG
jgi:prevent-host-death family protein